MTFTLTREERKAIAGGDRTALKRATKPDIKGGEEIVLARSRGGRQFVGRTEEERIANRGATIEIPTVPTLWIVLKPPVLKHGKWSIGFTAHDERRTQRRLAAVPNPPSDPGLRTRSGETVDREGIAHPRKVKRETHKESRMSEETARGYGGGLSAVDDLEAVDDATLSDFARRVEEEGRLLRAQQRAVGRDIAAEAAFAKSLHPSARRRAERAARAMRAA